jgi:hypothetical protein
MKDFHAYDVGMRKHFGLTILILICLGAGPSTSGFQQDTALRDDTYAVYSALFSDARIVQQLGYNGAVFIEETTVAGSMRSGPSAACYPPTPANEADWREALAALSQHKFSSEKLEPLFKMSRPYTLLDGKAVAEFREQGMREEAARGRNWNYAGAKRLYRLSPVFFNQQRTLALTETAMWCGGLCGEGGWKVFEKVDGQWQPYGPSAGRSPCLGWIA